MFVWYCCFLCVLWFSLVLLFCCLGVVGLLDRFGLLLVYLFGLVLIVCCWIFDLFGRFGVVTVLGAWILGLLEIGVLLL